MGKDVATKVFYDLSKSNNIGHKIISYMKLSNKVSKEFLVEKLKIIITVYPTLTKIYSNYNWEKSNLILDNHIKECEIEVEDLINNLLTNEFPKNTPKWQIFTIKSGNSDYYLFFVCDHCYGDGATISDIVRYIFDNTSYNDKKTKKLSKLSFFYRCYIFFKVLFLIFIRMYNINFKTPTIEFSQKCKQINIATLSLEKLKIIRNNYSCTDSTSISVNDLIHSLLVKTNSLYFNKEAITSIAMFNRREKNDTFLEKNKLGYILLSNKDNELPEEVIRDVHEFMTCYKETPLIPMTTFLLESYYYWNKEGAINLLKNINHNVDFIISNYAFEYKDKTINSTSKIENIYAMVNPCHGKQLYSITSYDDNLNIYLTYYEDYIEDIEKLKQYFQEAYHWIENTL